MGKWIQHPDDQRTDAANHFRIGSSNMETIPPSAVCTFVGEGAANVVFELSGVEDHPDLNGTGTLFRNLLQGIIGASPS